MNVFDAISQRYSVRSYQDRIVEKEKIESIFSAVRLAPSAKNMQEWRFVVVRDKELLARLGEEGGQALLKKSPLIIAACAEESKYTMRGGELAYPIDLAIAIDHLTLAATAMGLGTCWVGSFDAPAVKEILKIPPEIPLVSLICLGYPAEDSKPRLPKPRKPITEILLEDSWQNPWPH